MHCDKPKKNPIIFPFFIEIAIGYTNLEAYLLAILF
jgi:hypothetical protein